MRKTHRIHKKIAGDKVFCAIVLTLFCLMIIFPFLNVLAISLSSRLSVSQGRVWLWPVGFNLESYKRAFAYDGFLRSYWNTIRYTFMDTVLSLAITMLTAYPLSKSYLRGRKFFNVFFVFTMLFSGGLIASYINMTKMGLNGTIWAVLFPAACSPYTIILMRTFFEQIPTSMEESAFIDGANDFHVFTKITIPLSKPIISTVVLLFAVNRWNSWFNEFKEKLNLAMASGTAPDLFMIHGADEAKRYVNQDLLLCIEDYWQDYPNIAKYIDTEKVREAITYSDNGKIYTTVRQYSTPVYWFGLLARKDIINDLGFEYDGTIESLTDLMRAMKEETGSYVFSVRNGVGSLVTNFASIFGASMGGVVGWNANEGKYTFEGNDEHLYNELVWLNQLYTEGLMDPEYALNSTEMWEEKMSTGKATVTFDYLTRSEDFTNAVRGEDPNAAYELGPIAMPVTADGFKPKTYAFSSIDVNYQLGINADTKYPEICMQILNYIYSDESIIDANYGEEGVTFDYVDGEPVLNENIPTVLNNYQTPGDPIDIDEYKAAWLGIFNVVTDTDLYALTYYGPYSYPGYKLYSENEWLMDLDPVIPASYFTTEEEAEKSDIMTALSEYCNAQIQDFIEGTRPLTEEEYAKFQDECLNEYGAARWCEIMNTAYAAWKG